MNPHLTRIAADIARALVELDALPIPDTVDPTDHAGAMNARASRRHEAWRAAMALASTLAAPEPLIMPPLAPDQRRRLRALMPAAEVVPVRPTLAYACPDCGHKPHAARACSSRLNGHPCPACGPEATVRLAGGNGTTP